MLVMRESADDAAFTLCAYVTAKDWSVSSKVDCTKT